jgi:hypothetical protein
MKVDFADDKLENRKKQRKKTLSVDNEICQAGMN